MTPPPVRGRPVDRGQETPTLPDAVSASGPWDGDCDAVLTAKALEFLVSLHRSFEPRRRELLAARRSRQQAWDHGELPRFLPETQGIRQDGSWRIAPLPEGLLDRRVEITGPVERKLMINALNSGARVFMADFEDAHSPTWRNTIAGQRNLLDHSRGRLHHTDDATGKQYSVGKDPAGLVVRVRGLHMDEAHLHVDGEPIAAPLFDFGLHFWHNAKALLRAGLGPWYYLPKIEHHEEARFFDDVFHHAERALGLETGTIKVTCLIETFPAVFQMDEIIHALREHMAGLNAGRWDYIFSCIKVAREHPDKVLPDRAQITMTVPFMRAYTELLVRTCHKRGAFAIGGMSAYIPDPTDEAANERAVREVRTDKEREARDGFDGTWVAHPGLVGVAKAVFDEALGGRVNQLELEREDVQVTEEQLQDLRVEGGRVTVAGVRTNLDVALSYLASWLAGKGAVSIHGLMEDTATAEICRSQVWQWVHHGVKLDNGTPVTKDLVLGLLENLVARKAETTRVQDLQRAVSLLRRVCLTGRLPEFLTHAAYQELLREENA